MLHPRMVLRHMLLRIPTTDNGFELRDPSISLSLVAEGQGKGEGARRAVPLPASKEDLDSEQTNCLTITVEICKKEEIENAE